MISVICPTYNRQAFLNQTMDSFLRQDYKDKEMIVVNDGGTIPTVPEGIKLFNIEHGNQSIAQNYGIEHSEGEFICTLDDDDLFYDNYSLSQRAYELENFDTEVVWTGAIDIWEDGSLKDKHPVILEQDIWNRDQIFINSMMWRRSIKNKIGYWFNEDLTSNEDWDFKIRCLKKCKCKGLNMYSTKHRVHPSMRSTAHRGSGELDKNMLLMKKQLKEYK